MILNMESKLKSVSRRRSASKVLCVVTLSLPLRLLGGLLFMGGPLLIGGLLLTMTILGITLLLGDPGMPSALLVFGGSLAALEDPPTVTITILSQPSTCRIRN